MTAHVGSHSLTLTITNGKLEIQSLGVDIELATRVLAQAQLFYMKKTMEICAEHTPDKLEEVKGALYDMYNTAASNVLDMFDPTGNKGTNLTEQAIMEAENKIIMTSTDLSANAGAVDNAVPIQ